MNLEQKILSKLTDGGFHSGQALADDFAVSRASVWNMIQKLQAYGLEIYSVRGKGYKLPHTFELLSENKIKSLLVQRALRPNPELNLHWKIPSTNEFLAQLETCDPVVCLSEMQSQGRGRRGRAWVSPPGGNIYLSYKWQFSLAPASLSALSLAVSVGVMRVLRRHKATEIGVKWPNDIVHDGRKLAGILLEMQGEADGPCSVIVGIGINVRLPIGKTVEIEQPWVDLEQISSQATDRSTLVVDLVVELTALFQLYEEKQMQPFLQEWMKYDHFNAKLVSIYHGESEHVGIARGIDVSGNIILENQGKIRRFSGGEVSLRLHQTSTTMV